jgi:predicted RNA methylase
VCGFCITFGQDGGLSTRGGKLWDKRCPIIKVDVTFIANDAGDHMKIKSTAFPNRILRAPFLAQSSSADTVNVMLAAAISAAIESNPQARTERFCLRFKANLGCLLHTQNGAAKPDMPATSQMTANRHDFSRYSLKPHYAA